MLTSIVQVSSPQLKSKSKPKKKKQKIMLVMSCLSNSGVIVLTLVSKDSVDSGKSDAEPDVPEIEVHAGRNPQKGQWAMSQFIPSVATNGKGGPIWKWQCNWCK